MTKLLWALTVMVVVAFVAAVLLFDSNVVTKTGVEGSKNIVTLGITPFTFQDAPRMVDMTRGDRSNIYGLSVSSYDYIPETDTFYLGAAIEECFSCTSTGGGMRIQRGIVWPTDAKIAIFDCYHYSKTGVITVLWNQSINQDFTLYHQTGVGMRPYRIGFDYKWADFCLDLKGFKPYAGLGIAIIDGGTFNDITGWGDWMAGQCLPIEGSGIKKAYRAAIDEGSCKSVEINPVEVGIMCEDGLDNDGDNLIDCKDPDCECLESWSCESWSEQSVCGGECPSGFDCLGGLNGCSCVKLDVPDCEIGNLRTCTVGGVEGLQECINLQVKASEASPFGNVAYWGDCITPPKEDPPKEDPPKEDPPKPVDPKPNSNKFIYIGVVALLGGIATFFIFRRKTSKNIS